VFGHVFCDFDGTLVDSSDGILGTLRDCLESAGLRSKVELGPGLIGPPLRTMLQMAVGAGDAAALDALEAAFRREYDERGYLATRPYPGIVDALLALRARGVHLHIVTNKRRVPTLLIIDMLGWPGFFATVSTLEGGAPGSSKAQVVRQLLRRLDVSTDSVALVGDSVDDAIAARDNGLFFGWATWGYGRHADLAQSGVPMADASHLTRLILGADPAKAAHEA
jgi:phosphoglycolate phosphatase